MKTVEKKDDIPIKFHPLDKWSKILPLNPVVFAPLIAECNRCDTGAIPLTDISPTGYKRPLSISLPTLSKERSDDPHVSQCTEGTTYLQYVDRCILSCKLLYDILRVSVIVLRCNEV